MAATKKSTRRPPRDPNALDLRTPPKACRAVRCDYWLPARRYGRAQDHNAAIMRTPGAGGAGEIAVASAAMFHTTLLTSEQRKAAVAEFDETVLGVEWVKNVREIAREKPYFSVKEVQAEATRIENSGGSVCKVYAWVYRKLERDSKVHNRDLIDWYNSWGGVALWLFMRLPLAEQWALVKHVNERQAEQIALDALAFDAARRIYSA